MRDKRGQLAGDLALQFGGTVESHRRMLPHCRAAVETLTDAEVMEALDLGPARLRAFDDALSRMRADA